MCLLIQKASDPVISNNQGQGRWLHGKTTNHTGLTAQLVPGSYIKSRMWWSESVILTFYWEAEARVSPGSVPASSPACPQYTEADSERDPASGRWLEPVT